MHFLSILLTLTCLCCAAQGAIMPNIVRSMNNRISEYLLRAPFTINGDPMHTVICFNAFLETLKGLNEKYEEGYAICLKKSDEAQQAVDEEVQDERVKLEADAGSICTGVTECNANDVAFDFFKCYASGSSKAAKVSNSLNAAANDVVLLMKYRYETILYEQYSCTNKTQREYTAASNKANQDLDDCLAGKPIETPSTPSLPQTTELPTEEPSTQDPSAIPSSTPEPSTNAPSTEDPSITATPTQDPSTQDPQTNPPSTEDPPTMAPSTKDPSTILTTLDSSTNAPSTQYPQTNPTSTEDPTTIPTTLDPSTNAPSTQDPQTNPTSTQDPQTNQPSTDDPLTTASSPTQDPQTNPTSTQYPQTNPTSTEEPTTIPPTLDPSTNPPSTQYPQTNPTSTQYPQTNPLTTAAPSTITAVTQDPVKTTTTGSSEESTEQAPEEDLD